MTIGEKIRVLRRDKNMSQSELAKVLGVTNQAISKWEKDISNPDISLLPDLAAYSMILWMFAGKMQS